MKSVYITRFVALLCAAWLPALAAQDHSTTDHSTTDQSTTDHSMMDQGQMPESEPTTLRDPHAYSGGYVLNTGPYSLPQDPEMVLANSMNFFGLWMDRFEYRGGADEDAAELEGHAWWGNSYRRMVLKTEAGIAGGGMEEGELAIVYSHAVTAFWNAEFGARREFNEAADRNWLGLGLNGLAPHWFEIDATVYLGENGDTALELEAEYDLYLSQRLILQPRLDLTAYGDSDVELGRGSGLSSASLGVRLRYEIRRQLAPYLGVERVSRFGETADLLPVGLDRNETRWLLGVRFWF